MNMKPRGQKESMLTLRGVSVMVIQPPGGTTYPRWQSQKFYRKLKFTSRSRTSQAVPTASILLGAEKKTNLRVAIKAHCLDLVTEQAARLEHMLGCGCTRGLRGLS
ncbi:MLH3 [Symbiodinium sp. CCMP2592]|nr:MLH3 [Symbiodinium sp. CCMP2592]